MKLSVYNGSLNNPKETGSFYVVAKSLIKELQKRNLYTEDRINYPVIVPECLDTLQKFNYHIPLLASEYSMPPNFVTQWLSHYNSPIFAISEFARQNLIRGRIDPNRIHTCWIGTDPEIWYPIDVPKFDKFTFVSVNSSNDRSGFEVFIPEFLKFAKDKDCQLIIKDGNNPRFKQWINDLNSEKIVYIDEKYSEKQLRELYNKCHVHVYYNHTTSFGMTILDSALCGIPSLVNLGSAPREFVPEWTQTPYLVKTETKPLDSAILKEWEAIGLHTSPPTFYPFDTNREAIISDNIIPSLQYAWDNYEEMKKKNQEHQFYIKENLGWDKTVDKLLEVLMK